MVTHFAREVPDTPENRKMLVDLANNKELHRGIDRYGNDWHVRQNADGTQDCIKILEAIIGENSSYDEI